MVKSPFPFPRPRSSPIPVWVLSAFLSLHRPHAVTGWSTGPGRAGARPHRRCPGQCQTPPAASLPPSHPREGPSRPPVPDRRFPGKDVPALPGNSYPVPRGKGTATCRKEGREAALSPAALPPGGRAGSHPSGGRGSGEGAGFGAGASPRSRSPQTRRRLRGPRPSTSRSPSVGGPSR